MEYCFTIYSGKMMQKRFLNTKELAGYLGISISTLYDWVNQRRIPYVKISNLVRFDLEEISKWVDEKRKKAIDIL